MTAMTGAHSARSAISAWISVLLVVACTLSASAGEASTSEMLPALVLEAHVNARSLDVATTVDPILDELDRRGFVARPMDVAKALGGRAPRPGIRDGGKTAGEITRLIEAGYDAFTQGRYKEAATALNLAVHQIKRNPGLLVLDASNAKATFNAFVGLALSQAKLGDAAASVETMTELIRAFNRQSIGRAEYGPQAEQFYRTVQKQTQLAGRGRLAVSAGDGRAMIFLDGELRGVGRVSIVDLVPGTYRVFIHTPGGSGRQYEVDVRANAESKLEVDWKIDSSLSVTDSWVGFTFSSDVEREKEATYVDALARRWGCEAIVILGSTQLHGAPAVVGTLYRPGGQVVRRALVVPNGNPERLRALARFVAEGTLSENLRVLLPLAQPRRVGRESAWWRTSWPTRLFLGGGLVAVAAGAALFAVDQDRGHLDARGVSTRYYWDTAPFGVASTITGLGSIGIGLWWWMRNDRRAAPVVTVGRSHVAVSWTTTF